MGESLKDMFLEMEQQLPHIKEGSLKIVATPCVKQKRAKWCKSHSPIPKAWVYGCLVNGFPKLNKWC